MQLDSKATQIKIAIAKNNSNTLVNDSARDAVSTLNENLFQGHTTNNSYISYKFKHSRKCNPRDTQMWITADRAGSDRMAVSDLGARYGWSRDRSSRQPWLPGPVAPGTHEPLLVQGRIVTGIAACALAERRVAKTKQP